jgi:NADP-reducing hydrogenase subunit HndC|uniref:4Fe-4S dicluster domain-containing protein n=1 Tax=Desulfobacca acetoxidans TaxID=60893 RepID=A0A7V6DPP5_9BACT
MKKIMSAAELQDLSQTLLAASDPDQPVARVCLGPGCLALGAEKVSQAFRSALKKSNANFKVQPLIKTTGCHGLCSQGTLVNLSPGNFMYVRVKPEDVPEIVETTLVGGKVVERLLYSENGTRYRTAADIPFYRAQQKVILKNVGTIDPLDIKDAIMAGAYQSMAKALLEMSPDEVIHTVEVSGLRGRGGGGFPTAYKWRRAAENAQEKPGPVFLIANGEEGDPGAFMDRAIMEGDPHAVIEGMIIGGYAMGAHQGFLYVRHEYPIAIQHLSVAVQQAYALGLLGKNILGSGFDFDIQLNRGAGAYVCGEETAIIASLEGRVGEPVVRPPYPVELGLWGRPTVINNVETWANVPHIIRLGAESYAKLGVPHSTGTKIFSLVGKVRNSGLVEVPMGISLGALVEEIGGGVPGQAHFKAVQTGGPSGGIVPYELKDVTAEAAEKKTLSVDFDSMARTGSIMGGGGMIVMDNHDCVVDLARYFLRFLEEESCGKCLPCRLGLKGMLGFLDHFAKGEGTPEDIDALESLGQALVDGSLCGLGKSAPNAVLTSIRYFRDEYLAHIVDHKCPAGVCKDLISFSIDPETCDGCGLCAENCPEECITGKKKKLFTINPAACIRCGVCRDVCPVNAVHVA